MPQCGKPYEWSRRDRIVYVVAVTPFLVALVGAAYVLATNALYLTVLFLVLYFLVNFFQAGCCVGCPYRGRYCPAVFGIYLSNVISTRIYAGRAFDAAFFKLNANLAEMFLLATLFLPVYWLALSGWAYVVAYLSLIVAHGLVFFPTMCVKCSYHDTCPGGQATLRLLRSRPDQTC